MPEGFCGELRLFGFDWAPRGWAHCGGQLLPINEFGELFSLIGTHYGGDGRTTFALPDLRGRVPIHYGQGPGLRQYNVGEMGGMEMVQLTEQEMPRHSHSPQSSDQPGNQQNPNGGVCADEGHGGFALYQSAADGTMQPTTSAGGNMAHNNMQPYTVGSWCICLWGDYPPRN